MRRDLDDSTEETFEEWRRVVGPLMSLNPDPDPLVPILDDARITTVQVNLAWFENEGDAMDLRPELVNVRCPTLVLVGEHDPVYPVALAEEIVTAIPDGLAGFKWCRTQRMTSLPTTLSSRTALSVSSSLISHSRTLRRLERTGAGQETRHPGRR